MLIDTTSGTRGFLDSILRMAGHSPSRLAGIFLDSAGNEESRITYGELAGKASAIAARLLEDHEPGERMLLLYLAGPDFLPAFLGCLMARMIPVPLPIPSLNRENSRIDAVLRDATPTAILTGTNGLREQIEKAFPGMRVVATRPVEARSAELPLAAFASEDLAYLQYTSGSTSDPKGVRITHGNVLANLEAIQERIKGHGDDTMVTWLPHFHDMGLVWGLLYPLWRGIRTVVLAPASFMKDPSCWLRAISRYRGSLSGAPNFAYDLCVRKVGEEIRRELDMSAWRWAVNGSEPIHPQSLRDFHEAFADCGMRKDAMAPCYGLAEATLAVTIGDGHALPTTRSFDGAALEEGIAIEVDSTHPGAREMVACGKVATGHEVRIADPSSGVELPPCRVGEVWVHGPSVGDGFWSEPGNLAPAFSGQLAGDPSRVFLRTGDRGVLIEGQLFLAGRLKDLIIVRGRNYAPQDIELCARKASPMLAPEGSAAFSVEISGERGESLILFAEVEREYRKADFKAVAPRLRDAVRAEFDLELRAVVFLGPSKLPKTSSGKVQRGRCRQLFLAGAQDALATIWFGERAPTVDLEDVPATRRASIDRVIARALRMEPSVIVGDRSLVLQGLDSLSAVELVERLEGEVGITIALEDVFDGLTADQIAARVACGGTEPAIASRDERTAARTGELRPAESAGDGAYPLTDLQQAYWIGRGDGLEGGGVACQAYMEFEVADLDVDRLETAWNRIVSRHEMLRAVIDAEGRLRIVADPGRYRIERIDLSGQAPPERNARLAEMRETLSHLLLPTDRWPLFRLGAVGMGDGRNVVQINIDLLIADFASIQVLSNELEALYRDPAKALPVPQASFLEHVLDQESAKRTDRYHAILEAWRKRVPRLPAPPELPLVRRRDEGLKPRFRRRQRVLERPVWEILQAKAREHGSTPSALLLAAYAEVLGRWSSAPSFSLAATLFNRSSRHAGVVGDYTTVTPVIVERGAQRSFAESLRDTHRQLLHGIDSRIVGGVRIQRELGRHAAGAPGVVFSSFLGQGTSLPFAWLGRPLHAVSQTPQVCLDHQAGETEDGLWIVWDALEEVFPSGMLDDMIWSYDAALRRLAEIEWNLPLEIPLPPRQEEVRNEANSTRHLLPTRLLHQLFEIQAEARPDAPAVITPSRRLTYGELDHLSGSLAHILREKGARPNTLVAVALRKGWEQAVAVLAVLKAGAAYLPMDPDLPEERRDLILDKALVDIVVSERALFEDRRWPARVLRVVVEEAKAEGPARLEPVQALTDLAYVIYTSGSTGTPKGVMIDHRGACNTILDLNERFSLGPEDRVLGLSALNFDLSVYDLFGLWACGGAVVVPDPRLVRDPGHWRELAEAERVTLWNTVPALMEMLVEQVLGRGERLPDSLRLVFLSGDWIPVTLPGRIREAGCGARLISMGGATEASIWSILHPIEEIDPTWKSIPYGKPMANQSFHVLDTAMQPVPEWVPGQLFIGGIGVAKGYWQEPVLTGQRFVPMPGSDGILYRTGDLGRYLPDGSIEFLGREDFQVKVQGYRIELEEVEAAMLQHPGVLRAVATVVEGAGGGRRLVAYFVSDSDVDSGELKRVLASKLPAYMVPTAMVRLETLPLSPNGKVDRKALPPIPGRRKAEPAKPGRPVPTPATGNDACEVMSRIWRELLRLDEIPSGVGFFELGGDSLAATRLASKVRAELGVDLPLPRIFENPGFDEMLGEVERRLASQAGAADVEHPAGSSTKPGVVSSSSPTPPTEPPQDGPGGAIKDATDKLRFKLGNPGVRRDLRNPVHALEPVSSPLDLAQRMHRRSFRRFLPETVSRSSLSHLLGALSQARLSDVPFPKLHYASAGGLYPVQAYLFLKPGRVEGYAAGSYYYDPERHALILLQEGDLLSAGNHRGANGAVYSRAAFQIFLVADREAIEPVYGAWWRDFCLLEAGAMCQVLETRAPERGLGVCQIGGFPADGIRRILGLEPRHAFLHTLLGGPIASSETTWEALVEESKSFAALAAELQGESPRHESGSHDPSDSGNALRQRMVAARQASRRSR